METTKNYFPRDTGILLGRSMHRILRNRDTIIAVTIIVMPIVFMLLLVYVSGCAIQILEEIFLAKNHQKKEN